MSCKESESMYLLLKGRRDGSPLLERKVRRRTYSDTEMSCACCGMKDEQMHLSGEQKWRSTCVLARKVRRFTCCGEESE
jgi:hypothetical protein